MSQINNQNEQKEIISKSENVLSMNQINEMKMKKGKMKIINPTTLINNNTPTKKVNEDQNNSQYPSNRNVLGQTDLNHQKPLTAFTVTTEAANNQQTINPNGKQ